MRININREQFAAAMVRTGVNNNELAGLTGLNRSTISAVKNGKNCSPITAQKLVAVLGEEILDKANNIFGKES